jgi:hypothetical protein
MPILLKSFRQNLTYKLTALPSRILEDLNELRQLNQQAERRVARFKSFIPLIVLGTIVSFIAPAVLFGLITSSGYKLPFLAWIPTELVFFLLLLCGLSALVCWVYPQMAQSDHAGYFYKLGNNFFIATLGLGILLVLVEAPWILLNPMSSIILPAIIITSSIILYNRFKRLDLQNYRYELAIQLLQLLDQDLELGSRVSTQLSFVQQVKQPLKTIPYPKRPGWKIDVYHNPWLRLRGLFANRNEFQIICKEKYHRRYGRNINGKSREKFQQRGLEISLRIQLPLEGYSALSQLQGQANQQIYLPANTRLKQLILNPRYLLMKVVIPGWLGGARIVSFTWPTEPSAQEVRGLYETVVMMLLSAHQILNMARSLSIKSA